MLKFKRGVGILEWMIVVILICIPVGITIAISDVNLKYFDKLTVVSESNLNCKGKDNSSPEDSIFEQSTTVSDENLNCECISNDSSEGSLPSAAYLVALSTTMNPMLSQLIY